MVSAFAFEDGLQMDRRQRRCLRQLDGTSGPAELHEEVRGPGWRHAIGELVTCPFYLGQWVATGFVFGGMLAPRLTRAVAASFAVHAVADGLQFAYAALERTDR